MRAGSSSDGVEGLCSSMGQYANSGNTADVWSPVRAALRYVTQKPWNRIPALTKTFMYNPVLACLAGGRNKACKTATSSPPPLHAHSIASCAHAQVAQLLLFACQCCGTAGAVLLTQVRGFPRVGLDLEPWAPTGAADTLEQQGVLSRRMLRADAGGKGVRLLQCGPGRHRPGHQRP